MTKETFTARFLEIFSMDTGVTVTLNDTPVGLGLDSLDMVELGLEFEDKFSLQTVDTLDLVSFVEKPLTLLHDALYGLYCNETEGLDCEA